jgi:hypothetical protein
MCDINRTAMLQDEGLVTLNGYWKVHITSGHPCACDYNDQFDLIGYVCRFDW